MGLLPWETVIIGVPFVVLALAGTPDCASWLLAIVLTAALSGHYLYDLSREPGTGVNFVLGFVQMIIAPIVISGLALVTAGLRGKIPWDEDGR